MGAVMLYIAFTLLSPNTPQLLRDLAIPKPVLAISVYLQLVLMPQI